MRKRVRNFVQLAIGGWQVPGTGVEIARERSTMIFTAGDIERMGIDVALEVATDKAQAVSSSPRPTTSPTSLSSRLISDQPDEPWAR